MEVNLARKSLTEERAALEQLQKIQCNLQHAFLQRNYICSYPGDEGSYISVGSELQNKYNRLNRMPLARPIRMHVFLF